MKKRLCMAVAVALIAAGSASAQMSVIVRKADNSQAVDPATSENQTAPQAAAGSDASKALAIQGVTGGKAISTTLGASLPAGANAIGTVGVTSLPALPAGSNAIGSVSVSNFPATQPISATALPLPAGAATEATLASPQAAAGSDASTAIAVQGVANGKAIKVDGSAVTQPVLAVSLPLPTGAATAANQTATQANAGADASKAIAIQGVTGGKAVPTTQTGLAWTASGVAPVTCALTSATSCGPFTPSAGRDFNVSGWGTFVASFQLERSFDSGATWLPITAAGSQLYQWTAPESESATESEYGVQYRARVTSYTSGTLNVRLSQ